MTRRPTHRTGAAMALAALAVAGPLAAQGFLDPDCARPGPAMAPLHLDGFRLAELTGALDPAPLAGVRASSRRRLCAGHGSWREPRLTLLPVAAAAQRNSAYPRILLNGPRWAGVGLSTELVGGVAASWGPLSAALNPVFAWQENRDFETLEVERSGVSRFAWYWRPINIDWPQRFGPESFWAPHPGDSYIRLDLFGVAAGFSTEGMRWGPARRNPILMSGSGPGFPHAFLGTSRPVDVGVGALSLEMQWGHLAGSDWFTDATPETRILAGLVFALEPRWVPGLSVGFSRAYQRNLPPEGWPLLDYLLEPWAAPFSNKLGDAFEADNDMAAVFARWVFPPVGFEVYVEYARDDLWDSWIDLMAEPEHSGAITAGLQSLVPLAGGDGSRHLRVAAEITSLNLAQTHRSQRPEAIWYTHSRVRHGHTHLGQLLGAPIGPASDAQSLELDVVAPRWVAGAYIERIRRAALIYWQVHAPRFAYFGHDLELTAGARGGWRLPELGLELMADLALSGRYNRDFIPVHSLAPETGYERNFSLQVGASWNPASARTGAAGGPVSRPTPP